MIAHTKRLNKSGCGERKEEKAANAEPIEQAEDIVSKQSYKKSSLAFTDDELLDDLLIETNFFQLWKKNWKIPRHFNNYLASIITAIILVIFVKKTNLPTPQLASLVRDWADLGFNFAASMLGFLIAGFTISTTLNKPELYILMASRIKEETGLSYLKDNFFRLIRTFISFMLFIGVCLGVKLFAFSGGPTSLLTEMLFKSTEAMSDGKRSLAQLGLIWMGSHFVYVLMSLHPFIFNIYHLVMTGIRFGVQEEMKKTKQVPPQ